MIKIKFICDLDKICSIDVTPYKGDIRWETNAEGPLRKLIDHWMRDYRACKESNQELPLDLESLPPFTKKVLKALQNIPMGQTTTYQELAKKIKSPKAARAVGNACGRNPFPVIIPCHRVLRSDKTLGGFSLGTSLKETLLTFEVRT